MTEDELKQYLIDSLIDDYGEKVSLRDLICSEKFMEDTGFYRLSSTGEYEPISTGTITYHTHDKYGLTDEFLFNHYKEIGRIPEDRTFESWSKKFTKEKYKSHTIKERFKYDVINYFGLSPTECIALSLVDVKEMALMNYLELGFTISDFESDFDKLVKTQKISKRVLVERNNINKVSEVK